MYLILSLVSTIWVGSVYSLSICFIGRCFYFILRKAYLVIPVSVTQVGLEPTAQKTLMSV